MLSCSAGISDTWSCSFVDRFGDCQWNLFVLSLGICHENDRQIQREVGIGKQTDGGKSTTLLLVHCREIFKVFR